MGRTVRDSVWPAVILYILTISTIYSPVVFSGKSLLPSLYQPYGITGGWPHGYEGRTPADTFNIDLATPAYYESPVNRLVGDIYRGGGLPLWNPYQGAGSPLAAQFSSRVFFPYQIVEDISPTPLWDYFILGRLLVAAVFTFSFLRLIGLRFLPSFAGGLFYVFSGAFVWFINLEQFVNNAMMLPVHMYLLERLARHGRARDAALAALSFGLVILAGQPEVALYVLALGALYFAFRVFTGRLSVFRNLRAYFLVAVLGLGLSAPLILPFLEYMGESFHIHPPGGNMGIRQTAYPRAFQILTPSFSEVSQSYYPGTTAADRSGKGEQVSFRVRPNNGEWDWLGGYTGMGVFFLSMAGFVLALRERGRGPAAYSLFFTAAGLTVLAKNFGITPFLWIGHLPLFDMVWTQRWAGPVWVFCICVSAAFGMETLFGTEPAVKKPGTVRPGVPRIAAATALVIAAAYLMLAFINVLPLKANYEAFVASGRPFFERNFFAFEIDFYNFWEVPGWHEGIIRGIRGLISVRPYFKHALVVSPALGLALLGALVFLTGFSRRAAAAYACVALIFLELWWCVPRAYGPDWLLFKLIPLAIGVMASVAILFDRRALAAAGIASFFAAALLLDLYSPRGFPDRHDPFAAAPYAEFIKGSAGTYRVAGGGGMLFPNFASAAGIQDVRYINALSPRDFDEFRNRFLQPETKRESSGALWFTGMRDPLGGGGFDGYFLKNIRYYSLLGVKYLVMPPGFQFDGKAAAFKLPEVYRGEDAAVFENPYVLPRAFVVNGMAAKAAPANGSENAGHGSFDAAWTDAMPQALDAGGKVRTYSGGLTPAEIVKYGPNRVEIKSSGGGTLVLSDVYYPGWKAEVDGVETEIKKVYGALRGVEVGGGTHNVVFTYSPASFRYGCALFFVAILGCASLVVLEKKGVYKAAA